MPSAARSLAAPVYLFACLLLGGSAQGAWQNMVLQLAGIGLIAWAAAAPVEEPMAARARTLLLIALGAIAVVALQLIPLPAALWAHGPRARLAQDMGALGRGMPALPLSLTPYRSLAGLMSLIPPLAMLSAMFGLRAYRPSWLAAALIAGTFAGILLGALQVASPASVSPWYLYAQTNRGLSVGFFANANHMASLLVMTLPFIAAIGAAGRSRNLQRYSALLAILVALMMVVLVGLVLNRSLAGYGLGIPVVAASVLLLLPRTSGLRRWLAAGAGLSIVVAAVLLSTSSIGGTGLSADAASSTQSRAQILRVTGHAIADYAPLGSGLGSFLQVYRLYESPDTVTNEYVIHAHNDYAEIALELGVPGVMLIAIFLTWWGISATEVWRVQNFSPYARAASIASTAVLVHSLVDFPLRTAAISTAFAMCLALLLQRGTPPPTDPTDLRPTRHLVIR